MTSAALDRILAVLVLAMAATGLATLRLGHPSGAWLYVVHGVLAGALAAAVALKLRRSVPRALAARRFVRLALALVVSLTAAAALTGGWLSVASGELIWLDAGAIGRLTVLTLHAWIGLALVPIVVLHLLPRRWRLLRPGRSAVAAGRRVMSRRALLAGGLLGLAGVAAYGATAGIDRWRGGERRFTGSRWLPAGSVPPATTFFGEGPPPVEAASWRLQVLGRVDRPRTLSLADLRELGEVEQSAVLDCTSGWAVDTPWRGTPLRAVVEAAGMADGAREIVVRSATGWSAAFAADQLDGLLLAWEVAGQPLPVGNGAPVRLVVPDRRGLDWVKWVESVEVG
jgi:DMSO/TMAO reductase YedYZ molybdopterin-dependent catalytic subunit